MFCGRTFIFKWLKKHFCCSTHASQSEGGRHGKSRENQNLIPSYPDPAAQKHSNTNTVHHFAHDRKKEGEPPAWVVMNHLDCKFVHISLYEGDRCFSEWKGFVENQHFCRGNFQRVDKAVYLKCCSTFCAKFSTKNQNSFLFRKF